MRISISHRGDLSLSCIEVDLPLLLLDLITAPRREVEASCVTHSTTTAGTGWKKGTGAERRNEREGGTRQTLLANPAVETVEVHGISLRLIDLY